MAKKQPSTDKKAKPAPKPSSGSKSVAKTEKGAAPASAAEAKSKEAKPAPKKRTPAMAAPPARAITVDEIGLAAGEVWGALSNGSDRLTLAAVKKAIDAPADLVLLALGWLAREDKLAIDASGKSATISLK